MLDYAPFAEQATPPSLITSSYSIRIVMSNPLLDLTGLPPFGAIRPEHIEPAIDAILGANRELINKLLEENQEYTWANLVQPIEDADDRLNRAWSPVSHMNSVVSNDALRAAYNACLPKLSEYATDMGQNEMLYQAFRQIAAGAEYTRLNAAQRRIVDNALRDFRLSGVALNDADKKRYKDIMQELSSLTAKFEENLLDATNAWRMHIDDENRLAGLPESSLALLAQNARREGQPEDERHGWLLNLEFPSYFAVITYADDRALREQVYTAYVTRASELGPHADEWNNRPIMQQLLALRHEAARLLGFANYAERSIVTKMVASPEEVIAFLSDLSERSVLQARREFDELKAFAAEHYGIAQVQAWDVAYLGEKLRQARYSISQDELRPYFPEQKVLDGLFAIVARLYDIEIREISDVDTWHADVRYFEIRDSEKLGGEVRGCFYLDLYARAKKRGGAWMDECITRHRGEQGVQNPVAYLTCNFSPPVGDKPALFTHDEVITLFHEFGHGLHHMLTKVEHAGVAGINGVEWDAVELPSQFMENWCWQREALDLMAAHYVSGDKLPDELFERMLAARNFQSGMQMVRQLEFALFDFRLHLEYDPARGDRIDEILDQVRQHVAVVLPPDFNRFANSFSHIFAGGYAAGYYSYKWAEVLSADAFAAFEEQGIFDKPTGRRFLHSILEAGGSRDAMESFVEFRGRKPEIDALLRHGGIAA